MRGFSIDDRLQVYILRAPVATAPTLNSKLAVPGSYYFLLKKGKQQ